LITSIDDYSRKILFADFFPAESTWTLIHASQSLILTYGLPLRYYVNCLREFGFIQGEDIFWRKHVLQTDEIDTQWRKMMRLLNVDVSYALSPQAQGDELLADVQGNNIQPTRCMQGTQMRGRARKVTRKILTSPLNRF
jgi:hypothetical protein